MRSMLRKVAPGGITGVRGLDDPHVDATLSGPPNNHNRCDRHRFRGGPAKLPIGHWCYAHWGNWKVLGLIKGLCWHISDADEDVIVLKWC